MPRVIFGSTAIKHWFPTFREPKDLDVIDTDLDYYKYPKGHLEVFNSTTLKMWFDDYPTQYCSPNEIYTIKLSHLAWDINWDKHMHDLMFLKSMGCCVIPELLKGLIEDFSAIHGRKKVRMDVPEEQFFTSRISRRLPHDELHELMAFNDYPMHFRIREDLSKPLCSENLWLRLTDTERLQCAVEEVFVIALERYIWYPIKIARYKALKQLITSMTTGWFNVYLIEHFSEIMVYPLDKLEVVRSKLEEVQ